MNPQKTNKTPSIIFTLIFALGLFFQGIAAEIPKLTGPVMDQIGLLSSSQKNALSQKLLSFSKEKGSQLVVLIIQTTEPENIEEYGIQVAEKWQIGRKGTDDGVILIIAKGDRKVRIEVGYGLEGAIPDAYAKRIIEEIIVPDFRSGNFYHGVDLASDAIISLINGEALPPPDKNDKIKKKHHPIGAGLIIAFIILMMILRVVKNKVGSPVAIVIISIISILVWVFLGLVLAIFGFVFLSSLVFGKSRGGGGIYMGGGGFGGGSGFGGGGGFSGGGGSFGGGGASGGW